MKNYFTRNVASLLSVFKDNCYDCSFIMQLSEIKGLRQTLNETNFKPPPKTSYLSNGCFIYDRQRGLLTPFKCGQIVIFLPKSERFSFCGKTKQPLLILYF